MSGAGAQSRTALVTGAASGIGFEIAKGLHREGYRIIALIRPGSDGSDLSKNLEGAVAFEHADLADRASLAAAIARIRTTAPKLDLLVNNAGVLGERPSFNAAGEELHWAVNVLAPFRLIFGLASALSGGAVVNVSSGAALRAGRLDLVELRRPTKFRKLFGSYAQSKLALSLATAALAPEFASLGMHVVAVDPGPNKTKMTGGAGMPSWLVPIRNLAFPPPTRGARLVIDAAHAAANRDVDGAFFSGGRIVRLAEDPQGHALVQTIREACSWP